MYIARFEYKGKILYGEVKDNFIFIIEGDIYKEFTVSNKKISLEEVKILTPSLPSKLILVGLNYKDHAKELNFDIPDEPVIFMKPNTAIIAHKEDIIYPSISNRVDYEAELAFIIKKEAYKVKKDKAEEYILGYTCLNDVTARDLQKKDGQWIRAKSFNTFAPFGPYIYIPDENNFNPNNLKIEAYLNGELKQSSSTSNFIFNVQYLIEFISNVMTLYPGDVISTGTPSGIGPMKEGDTIEIVVEKVGRLVNKVRREE